MTKIEIPLDIPDIEIENIEINKEGDIIITVRSAVKGTRCHKCGRGITKLHCHDREITLRHLSILDGITNYFINRQTSGFVEGFNNKIKVIKRRCYGILNVKHLFQPIHLDLEGYSLFA